MDEFARIRTYFRPLAEGYAGAFALGDDAARLDIPATHDLIATVDAMVENVHFNINDGPQSIAQRLMRSNLSDLAAMGAEPHAYLLALSLPKNADDEWLQSFSQTLLEEQKIFGGHVVGGDSTRIDGPMVLSLTALGLVPKGQTMRRASKSAIGVKPLSLFVTGTIGDSAIGLLLKQGRKFPQLSPDEENYFKQRHLKPEPRLAVARGIRGFAKACVDISDGLVADIGHMAEQSHAHAVIRASDVPLSPPARKLLKAHPDMLEIILTGGEDYELAFALDESDEAMLTITSAKINVPLTKIGALQAGMSGEVQVFGPQNNIIPLKQKGWIHF